MKKNEYYDGQKLLSMNDKNGQKPEIYICVGNKTAGKTTYFNRLLVNRFLKRGEKFGLIYRFNYQLSDVASKFFKDIQSLFFPELEMTSKPFAKGIYHEIYLKPAGDDSKPDPCGYAFSLNSSDQIKTMSHLFSDVQYLLFDEFQSENGHYCSREIAKFKTLHIAIARGQGKHVRRVPVYMLSNAVSLVNPYFSAFGIPDRLKAGTKFLRGNGWVLEQAFNENASKALSESAFMRSFIDQTYTDYATGHAFMNDSDTFIEKVTGNGKYMFTLKSEGREYGLIEYAEKGVVYVTKNADRTFPVRIAVDLNDHGINYVLLSRYDGYIDRLRFFFDRGCFRFQDLECKNALLRLLNYSYL